MLNSKKQGKVVPKMGLLQRDPLSPHLFLIVQDVLSLSLSKSVNDRVISSIRIKRNCPPLSYIFFADDYLLFLKADLRDCSSVKDILNAYYLA